MNKIKLKKTLQSCGIKVHGNYVYKKDLKSYLSTIDAGVGNVNSPLVDVSCKFDDIVTPAHKTNAPDTYYVEYTKLPKCIKEKFEKAEPLIDNSRYTVGQDVAYMRIAVHTLDDAEIDMEIHLGDISVDREDEEGDEKDSGDIDEEMQDQASEMKATFDWRLSDVYFEVIQDPDEIKESFEDWKKKVDDYALDLIGMTPDDISGDYRWRDLYDEGFSTEEAYTSWEEDLDEDTYRKVRRIRKGK